MSKRIASCILTLLTPVRSGQRKTCSSFSTVSSTRKSKTMNVVTIDNQHSQQWLCHEAGFRKLDVQPTITVGEPK
ncbi:MAG: hypothetical protein ACR2NN_18335 [Bryobacteraceae bacterium]